MQYYLLSLKWSKEQHAYVWWGPDNSGYATDLNKAGIYTQEQIDRNPLYYRNKSTYPVPVEVVNSLYAARSIPTTDHNWKTLNIDVAALPHY